METFPELKEKLRIVILCGGYGTRMWPMSRLSLPKQFQPLLGATSFFQEALRRVRLGFEPENIYLSVPEEQAKFAQAQAPEIPEENVIAEPERRDTLGAIGYATIFIDHYFPKSLMAIVWGADHLLREEKRFVRLLKSAARICQAKDVICKIDVKPTYPATDDGWVKIGRIIGSLEGYRVYEFEKHIEKPDLELAKKLFVDKRWLINTGYFVMRTSVLLGYFKKYSPATYSQLMKIKAGIGKPEGKVILRREYHKIEKTSIDYGLWEKLSLGDQVVIPADLGWYDVGTWGLLYEALARGQKENVKKGEVEFMDSRGNIVYLPKGKIAAIIGAENLIVVDTQDGLLVCRRDKSGEVKKFVELLKSTNRLRYL